MRKGLLCLLVVWVCLIWTASSALADCPNTITYCLTDAGSGANVGTIKVGNCFNIWAFSFIPCDTNRAAPANQCNAQFPDCQGNCGACVNYADIGTIAYCYDKNGNCTRGSCGQ